MLLTSSRSSGEFWCLTPHSAAVSQPTNLQPIQTQSFLIGAQRLGTRHGETFPWGLNSYSQELELQDIGCQCLGGVRVFSNKFLFVCVISMWAF